MAAQAVRDQTQTEEDEGFGPQPIQKLEVWIRQSTMVSVHYNFMALSFTGARPDSGRCEEAGGGGLPHCRGGCVRAQESVGFHQRDQ